MAAKRRGKYPLILWLLLRVEDAHDVTKALGVFRDLEFLLGIVSRFLFYCFTPCVSSTRSKSPSYHAILNAHLLGLSKGLSTKLELPNALALRTLLNY